MKASSTILRIALLGIFLGGLISSAPAQNVVVPGASTSGTFSASVKPASLLNAPMGPALPGSPTNPSIISPIPLPIIIHPTFPVLPTNPFIPILPTNPITPLTPTNNTNNPVPVPAGLVGWWKGENNTHDSAGTNNGIDQNVTYTNGEVGRAFLMDNASTFIDVPASPSLNVGVADGFTIEGWIKPSDVNGLHPIIEWNNTNTDQIGVQFWIGQNPSSQGVLCAFFMDTNGNNYVQVASPANTLVANTWQHVAVTYSRTNGVISLYVNGAQVAQYTWGSYVPATAYDFWIGHRPESCGGGCWTDGTYLNGLLDELSVYNQALSGDQIQSIYNAGSAGKIATTNAVAVPSGLVAWWKGEDNMLDSANGHNGTAPNGVGYTGGVVGQAFSFNGTNSYVEVPDSADLQLTNDLTIEFWVKRKQIIGRPYGDIVVEKGGDWTSGVENYGVGFGSAGYGNLLSFFFANGNRGCTSVSDLNWHHCAVVVHNGDTDPTFYLDGVQQPVTHREGVSTINLNPSTAPLHIGAQIDPRYIYYSDTVVDELSIYNRALSSNEIIAIYNAGSAGKQPPTVSTNDSVTPPSGLIGWWKGDGNANDSVSGNNGINQNASYTNGEVGQAFAFDPENLTYGTYSGIQIADRPAYALTNALTIEGWVRPRGDGYIIFWRGDHRPGLDPYYLSMQGNNTLRFGICDAAGNSAYVDTTLNYFAWTHVAATLDGSLGTLSIYTNGVLAAQTGTNLRPFQNLLIDESPGIGIGNLNDGGNNFPFIGDIDEISLYNRALSVSEIQAIYTAGSAGKYLPPVTNAPVPAPAGLISWWKAEGNTLDSAGNNNGTVTVGNVGYAPAEVGLGFDFDGNAHRILVPDAPALNFDAGQDFSIEGWISPLMPPPDLTYGVMTIVDKRKVLNISQCLGYEFSLVDGQLNVRLSDSLNGIGNNWIAGPDLRDGKMHHVAVSLQRNSTNGGNLYVDGVCVLQFDPTSEPGSFVNTEPLHIGDHPDPTFNSFFKGRIDEISIYNRALSSNEISAIYNAGSAGKQSAPPAESSGTPQIFHLTPAVATNGATILVSGTNFNANGASNIVYFGAVQATVLSATKTSLVVRVPVGATFAPVTVTVGGLTASSQQIFEPTFLGDGSALSAASFGARLDLPAGNGPDKVVIADLDGDGKPDLIVAEEYGNKISLYRNISTNGLLTAASFAPPVDLATPPGQYDPYWMTVADIDGDGKLDIIISDYDSSMVSVYRNTCTPGIISSNAFATRVDFACGAQPQGIEVGDIDGDGRPDILTANRGDGTISILRNTGVAGSLTTNSFAPHVDILTGSSCDSLVVGDLDGDGKPDIAVANTDDGTISLLRNIGAAGDISSNSFAPKVDIAVSSPLLHMSLGDIDGDGKSDLVVAASAPQAVYLLHNNSTPGNLTFDQPVSFSLGGWGHSCAVADLNGDGKPDLAVVTELSSLLSVFQNSSLPGSFTNNSLAPRVDLSTGWNAWGVAAGDLDGDGRPDLIFCNNYDGTISIYQNQTPFSHNGLINPPVITSQPVSQTVLAGASATFSVTATGQGPLTYQWKFKGTNLAGATQSTLTLTNLHVNQAGNYSVRVTSSGGGTVTSSNAVLTVTAQTLLVYSYSGSEKVTAAQQEFSYAYSGQMFFIPGGTNGVFVGWATINGQRQYWVSPFNDYQVITIPGAAGRTYTVFGKVGNNTDTNGQSHIWSYLHKGQNVVLPIGSNQTISFPGLFTCNDNHIYPDPQTGSMVLREAVSTYNYVSPATQTANNTGQTVADLVGVLTRSLIQQGYTQQ